MVLRHPSLSVSNFSPIVSKRFRSVTYGLDLSSTATIGERQAGKTWGVAIAPKKTLLFV
jgi:hypothetical protein